MCQPSPGQRCAAHTLKRIISVKRRLEHTTARFDTLKAKIMRIEDNGEVATINQRNTLETLSQRKRALQSDLRLAVRYYDSTKTGQKELTVKIDAAQTQSEKNTYVRRQRQGAMLAGWHKAAWEREKSRKKALLSV